MNDLPVNMRKAIDYYGALAATGQNKGRRGQMPSPFSNSWGLVQFLLLPRDELRCRVVDSACIETMRLVDRVDTQPRYLKGLELPDGVMAQMPQVEAKYVQRLRGSPFGTTIRGALGHWFELINSKEGDPQHKAILGTGSRSKVREGLLWRGQGLARASEPVAVKKLSTDYIWLSECESGSAKENSPEHVLATEKGARAEQISKNEILFELCQALNVPDDSAFLRPIDVAAFETSNSALPSWSAFSNTCKVYLFYPKYEGDLIDLLDCYEENDRARERCHQLVAYGMLRGLKALERHSVAHLDIKPQNFLYSSSRGIVLSDFGFSQRQVFRHSDDIRLRQASVGTPYFCPELLDGGRWLGPLTHRQCHQRDLIAFAQSLYEMEHCDFFEPIKSVRTREELDGLLHEARACIVPGSASDIALSIWQQLLVNGRDVSLASIEKQPYFVEARAFYESAYPPDSSVESA